MMEHDNDSLVLDLSSKISALKNVCLLVFRGRETCSCKSKPDASSSLLPPALVLFSLRSALATRSDRRIAFWTTWYARNTAWTSHFIKLQLPGGWFTVFGRLPWGTFFDLMMHQIC